MDIPLHTDDMCAYHEIMNGRPQPHCDACQRAMATAQ